MDVERLHLRIYGNFLDRVDSVVHELVLSHRPKELKQTHYNLIR